MRKLPRELTVEELAELFEGRTHLVERLAAVEDPLSRALDLASELPESEQLEALNAHPRIGQRRGSVRSAAEQGGEDDPAVLAELARLNQAYEARFGFRFVVFVDRRPRSAIVPVLRERLRRDRAQELRTGLEQLVAIAQDRWERR